MMSLILVLVIMLAGVLLVRDVMTRGVKTVSLDANVREAVQKMNKFNIGSIVVMKGNRPVGILTERDIMRRLAEYCMEPSIVKVKKMMSHPVVTIKPDASIEEAARLMDEREISSVLVKEGEEFLGIITDRDIIGRVVSKGLDPRKAKASEVMSSPLITINADATVEEAAEKMRNNKTRRLVVEENHRKTGIIAESDMVRVAPELHFLIRERSQLEAQFSPTEPQEVTLTGFCEECGNYSDDLRNVTGRWLCEEYRS